MPKLDLIAEHVQSFDLHADLSLTPARLEQLVGNYASTFLEKKLPVFFAEEYRRRNTRILGLATLVPEAENSFHLHFTYKSAPEVSVGRSFRKVNDFLELVAEPLGVMEFSAIMLFSYPQAEFLSKLRLPFRFAPGGEDGLEFDEIRGLRLAKVGDGDKVQYSLVIDLVPGSNQIIHQLSFSFVGQIAEETILGAFQYGTQVSKSFVRILGNRR